MDMTAFSPCPVVTDTPQWSVLVLALVRDRRVVYSFRGGEAVVEAKSWMTFSDTSAHLSEPNLQKCVVWARGTGMYMW